MALEIFNIMSNCLEEFSSRELTLNSSKAHGQNEEHEKFKPLTPFMLKL